MRSTDGDTDAALTSSSGQATSSSGQTTSSGTTDDEASNESELPTDGPEGGSTTGSSEFGPRTMAAYAIRFGDIPEDEPGGMTTGATSGGDTGIGPPEEDDTLVVNVGFNAESCDALKTDTRCSTWSASFQLELEQQVPGTYDLAALDGGWRENAESPPGEPTECSGGFGPLAGQVVVESLTPTEVTGRFENIGFGPNFDLEGREFTAPRC